MARHSKSKKRGHPILKILFVLILLGMVSSLWEMLVSPRDMHTGERIEKEEAADTDVQERTIPEGVAEETSQEPVEAMAGEKPEEDIAASLALVEEKPVQLSMKVMDGKETLKCKVGETADPLELVQFSSDGSGDITAEASVASINLSHPHVEKVTYDVSTTSESGRITQETFVVEYQVVDDECPKIDFGHKKISIEEGTDFDPLSNINYVRDAVEGEAKYYSSEPYEKPEHSWYTVDSRVDPDEAGVYKVYVHASDSSGNVKDREYQVTVNEKKVEPVRATAPQGTEYVLNTNTHKFHYPWCSSVNRMKAKNRRDFYGTRDEVIQMGYDPCKNCNP